MKEIEGYLYIEDGLIFNPELKPSVFFFYDDNIYLKKSKYSKALKEWSDNSLPVENAWFSEIFKNWKITTVINEADYDLTILDAQKCLALIKDKTVTVTKIL